MKKSSFLQRNKIILFILLLSGLFVGKFQPVFFEAFIYWWLLVIIIFTGLSLNLKSRAYFLTALTLFFISALLTVFGLREEGEIVMRISYINWIIGIAYAVFEYKISKKSNPDC